MIIKEEIATQMILEAWHKRVQEINKILSLLSDENLNSEIAPQRNKGTWIIAHLAATNDSLIKILELGEHIKSDYRLYFNMSGKEIEFLPASEIRKYWNETSTQVNKKIDGFSTLNWFQKHASISSEDFSKEPHRNKLNVLKDRTSHLAYHAGQLVLLVKK
jgi:hypothetical protein